MNRFVSQEEQILMDEIMIAWKDQLILKKKMCLINEMGMASKPAWFLNPRVVTCVMWRCVLENHDQQKCWLWNIWVHRC